MHRQIIIWVLGVMMFNATFINLSVI